LRVPCGVLPLSALSIHLSVNCSCSSGGTTLPRLAEPGLACLHNAHARGGPSLLFARGPGRRRWRRWRAWAAPHPWARDCSAAHLTHPTAPTPRASGWWHTKCKWPPPPPPPHPFIRPLPALFLIVCSLPPFGAKLGAGV
jgi:hypothetical protein